MFGQAKGGANRVTDKAEIENLLEKAEENIPDSEFVESIRDWFSEKGFITIKQRDALINTANAEKRR